MPLPVSGGSILQTAAHVDLRRILQQVHTGASVRVLLQGDSGVGKATAVRHLLATISIPNLLVLEGSPSSTRAAFYPISEALGSVTERSSKLERAKGLSLDLLAGVLKAYSSVDLLAERLPQFVSIFRDTQPSAITEAADLGFRVQKMLAKLARGNTVIFFLRNLESYDASSLTLLDALLRNQNLPVSYVFTYDPVVASRQSTGENVGVHELKESLLSKRGFASIDFDPFTREETSVFLSLILHKHALTAPQVSSIHRLTGGNPAFILEMIHHLQEEEAIIVRDGTASLKDTVTIADLPRDMARLIDLRIDRLQSELREVIDVAAVVGVEFQPEPITHALELSHLTTLRRLRELERTHRLIREEINVRRFSYEAIRTRVYELLGPGLAQSQHLLLANFFAAHPVEFDNDFRVHSHFAAAGKLKDALPYLIRSAEQSLARGNQLEAAERFITAAHLTEEIQGNPETIDQLRLDGAISLQGAGKFYQARVVYAELSQAALSPRVRARSQLGLGLSQYLSDDAWKTVESLNKALELHEVHLSPEERLQARLVIASALYHVGEWDSARSQYRKCFREDLVRKDQVLLGRVRKSINMFYLPELSLPLLQESKHALKERRTDPLLWEIQHNIACNYLFIGELDTAATLFSQCLREFERSGSFRAAYPANNLGTIHLFEGRYGEAERQFQIVREAPLSEFDRVSADCHLAIIQLLRGDIDAGCRAMHQLRQDAYVSTETILRELVGHNLGWALYLAGDYPAAAHHLRESVPTRPHLWRELKTSNTARLLKRMGFELNSEALAAHEHLLSRSGRRDKWMFKRFDFWVSEVWFWE